MTKTSTSMVYYIGFYIYFVLLLLLLYPFTLFGIIFNYFVFFNNILLMVEEEYCFSLCTKIH